MLRYGKKQNQCHDDKRPRSNRGRARTSATADDREHANPGFRRSQTQLVEMRADKKRARLIARLAIESDLFDLELAKADSKIWLHGTDLTTFKDTITKHHRGYPFSVDSFVADPYEYTPDTFDWDWDCDEDAFRYLHVSRDYDDYDARDSDWDDRSDPDPEPIEAAWRDLWVDGRVYDPEGRDVPDDPMHDRHDYYDTYDYLAELENPLLLEREDLALPAPIEAAAERAIERHRAGERYFKQTGRTSQRRVA